ncbi:FAD-dependent oxidoreductase [Raoultibacter timonensis]|uniref:FAD-binding dehydrogenase n=1 Tax=Raoultibacter timonensis TaxID=1907662 RepID=A0ABN6MGI0_9ACTN|nr:FAD-dependent oxidoreductase [Raoultibacter timonensis]BDE97053.1 FAD-binding dehydrogenase [Raoultibacter timonensis]BDF51657.1 FAD-binding dehydrogenase [Raoultibacter timonensis]
MQTPKTEQEAFTTENRARGLSRRAFLTGTALLGLGGAVTALGGCAPQSTASSSEAAPENTGTSASGTSEYPWPDAPEAIAEDRIEETLEADAVIVGLGVSGVAAFRSAAEEGLSVIAVEKGTAPQCRSDNYCYVNGSLNERLGLPELDIDELAQEEWGNSGGYSNYRIVRKFMQNESEVFDWWAAGDPDIYYPSSPEEADAINGQYLQKSLEHPYAVSSMSYRDADWTENKAFYPVRIYFTDHEHVVNENAQRAIDAGGQALYGHFAEQLITDEDGTVRGVYVRNAETGQYKKITSRNGVILATGGCESDEGIMAKFYPTVVKVGNLNPWPNYDAEGNLTNTGDGYRLGAWAGADFSLNMAPMCHVMGGHADTADMSLVGMTTPHLHLNYNGERFMNEEIDCTDVEVALESQPQGKCFLIFDSHLDEQAPQSFDPVKGRVLGRGPWTLAQMEERVDGETVFKADTIEELLASIPGMDAESALASIERYNEMCANGYDDDFRKSEKYLWPVQDGPFCAQRTGLGFCLTTMGGLRSDEECRVYNKDIKPIPGLYAVGNIQGDRFAVKYPFKMPGISHSMAMYYGYVAGKNIAATPLA